MEGVWVVEGLSELGYSGEVHMERNASQLGVAHPTQLTVWCLQKWVCGWGGGRVFSQKIHLVRIGCV